MTEFGIDVSNNNDVHSLPPAGEWSFAYAKASEAANFDDAEFEGYVAEFDRQGKPWGPYHFAHPDANTADAEAAWFLGRAKRGALGWALDVETRGQGAAHRDPLAIMGADRLAQWCERFAQLVTPKLGQQVFYCNRSYATALYPRLSSAWKTWLATLDGYAHVPAYAGRTIDVEQHAIAGVDRNTARAPYWTTAPTPEDEDMIPPTIAQLADNGDLVIVPSGGARPWVAKEADKSLVAVFVFRVLDPANHYPMPDPIPRVTDPAQISAIRGWLASVGAGGTVQALKLELTGTGTPA
jgi:hypothetical protein